MTLTKQKNQLPVFKKMSTQPWSLLAPLLIVLLGLFLYPIIEVIRYSFTNLRFGRIEYAYTLHSFKSVFTDRNFLDMVRITFTFVIFSVTFQLINGFIVAFAIYIGEKLKLKGSVFVRTSVIISMAIPGIIIGVIWRMMLDESPTGILNYYLSLFGFGPVRFLTDPKIALISVIIANIWRGTANNMILLYAGLKTIPESILEAADVDGAGSFRKVFSIIIPSISPVLMICGLLSIIGTFNTFDMIMSLTGGGPAGATEVLALSSYKEIFVNYSLGKGSAIAAIILLINIIMAMIYFNMNKKVEV